MGKDKKHAGSGPASGSSAKDRHNKKKKEAVGVWNAPSPNALSAKPRVSIPPSKHKSYYELVENKNKKKKLEFSITNCLEPPPGFEFVSIGNPKLTHACKELSREHDAMVFIVSTGKGRTTDSLAHQMNRIGHHVRQTIVEQARREVGDSDGYSPQSYVGSSNNGRHWPEPLPEPIPETQQEINEQADRAIRDLFPRIPNPDRRMIIERAFKIGARSRGDTLVGLAPKLSLSRRVQLAVLAHIRHTHTRYDQLLKETSYPVARKTVESLCLDILVKWRGDEETGRDQLDEILREVIVISDSEDDKDSDNSEDSGSDDSVQEIPRPASFGRKSPPVAFTHIVLRNGTGAAASPSQGPSMLGGAQNNGRVSVETYISAPPQTLNVFGVDNPGKQGRRGFRRYQAALFSRWNEARERVRLREEQQPDEPQGYGPAAAHSVVAAQQNAGYAYQGPPLDRQEWTREDTAARGFNYGPEVPYYANYTTTVDSHGYSAPAPAPAPAPAYSYRYDQRPGPPPASPRTSSSLADRFAPRPRNTADGMYPLATDYSAQRTAVRSEEAQDYLVPSVEPGSPAAQPDPSARQLPPGLVPSERYYDEAPTQYTYCHSPSRRVAEYAPSMHGPAAVPEDNPFIQLPARREANSMARSEYPGSMSASTETLPAPPPAPPAPPAPSGMTYQEEWYRVSAPPLVQQSPMEPSGYAAEWRGRYSREAEPANPPPSAYQYVPSPELRAFDSERPSYARPLYAGDSRYVHEQQQRLQEPPLRYVTGHPPLPADVRVIRTNSELPEQQPYGSPYPLHASQRQQPPPPPQQGWSGWTVFR